MEKQPELINLGGEVEYDYILMMGPVILNSLFQPVISIISVVLLLD